MEVMYRCNVAKFEQNPELRAVLLAGCSPIAAFGSPFWAKWYATDRTDTPSHLRCLRVHVGSCVHLLASTSVRSDAHSSVNPHRRHPNRHYCRNSILLERIHTLREELRPVETDNSSNNGGGGGGGGNKGGDKGEGESCDGRPQQMVTAKKKKASGGSGCCTSQQAPAGPAAAAAALPTAGAKDRLAVAAAAAVATTTGGDGGIHRQDAGVLATRIGWMKDYAAAAATGDW